MSDPNCKKCGGTGWVPYNYGIPGRSTLCTCNIADHFAGVEASDRETYAAKLQQKIEVLKAALRLYADEGAWGFFGSEWFIKIDDEFPLKPWEPAAKALEEVEE